VIVDSSAIVAVLLRQPGYEPVLERLSGAGVLGAGSPTLAETGIVMTARMGIAGATLVSRFVQEAMIEVIPFGEQHARVAIDAFFRYGKGRDPAALNFGDCMTYAIASLAEQPLLCLGDDFSRTDLELAGTLCAP
jgi:ribonuclease VapC